MEKRTRNAEIILKEKAEKAEANNSKFCYGLNMTPFTPYMFKAVMKA